MQLFHYHLVTSKVRLLEARYLGKLGFGLVGLFAGPMVLAVLLAVWREWLEHQVQLADSAVEPLDEP